LNFLWKLVRDEISSDGSAFQVCGPVMEKALSVTWSRVCETTNCPCALNQICKKIYMHVKKWYTVTQ